MSARHIPESMVAEAEDLANLANSQLQQLNQDMKNNLNGLEQDVRDAKELVHQTQSKVKELEISIDKIEEPKGRH